MDCSNRFVSHAIVIIALRFYAFGSAARPGAGNSSKIVKHWAVQGAPTIASISTRCCRARASRGQLAAFKTLSFLPYRHRCRCGKTGAELWNSPTLGDVSTNPERREPYMHAAAINLRGGGISQIYPRNPHPRPHGPRPPPPRHPPPAGGGYLPDLPASEGNPSSSTS